jgi:hypothetical protein
VEACDETVSPRLTVGLLDLGGRQSATRGAVLLQPHCLPPAGLLLYAVDLVLRAGQLSNTTVVTGATVDNEAGVATVQLKASRDVSALLHCTASNSLFCLS